MKTLSFNSQQIISAQELKSWDKSLREFFAAFIQSRINNQTGFILDSVDPEDLSPIHGYLNPGVGSTTISGYKTLRINEGKIGLSCSLLTDKRISSIIINNESIQETGVSFYEFPETDDIEIPGIGSYDDGDFIYVGFLPIYEVFEEGTVSISGNQVTISGGDFSSIRDQSYKNPSKIRFYKSDGSNAVNNQIYEVISKISDTQIIITGSLTDESGIKFINVGSYDLRQGNLSDKSCYVNVSGVLSFNTDADVMPENGGFNICKLTFDKSNDFVITDVRLPYYISLSYFPSHEVLYRGLSQQNTGLKLFKNSSLGVDSPSILKKNDSSFSTPLSITQSAGASQYKLIISDYNQGHIYKVNSSVGHILKYIQLPVNAERNFKILVNTYQLIIAASTDVGGIRTYDSTGTLANIIVSAGTIVDFWCDNKGYWYILNIIRPKTSTDWVQVTSLYEGLGPLDYTRNIVKYKQEGNLVGIYLDTFPDAQNSPITFTIPITFTFDVIQYFRISTTDDRIGTITILQNGSTTISFDIGSSTSVGDVKRQINILL